MTGNMQMMMKFRDLQVAEDFSKMAELGYLDKEFTMYGAAFLRADTRRYIISSDTAKIYDFSRDLAQEQTYLTPVMTLTKVAPVPSGCEEDIARSVKIDLARKLQATYTETFFAALTDIAAEAAAGDWAEPLLSSLLQKLEGLFVEEKLQIFEGLIQYAFDRRLLTTLTYHQYQKWLKLTRREMEDDVIVKDLFERTFYGFAYRDDGGRFRYISNANRGSLYLRQRTFDEQGHLTTPIFAKAYGYNYTYTVNNAQDAFKKELPNLFSSAYLELLEQMAAMRDTPRTIAEPQGVKELPTEIGETLLALARKWGVSWIKEQQ